MKLITDWKLVLKRAWSIRLALLSAALAGIEMALPLFTNTLPRNAFLALSIAVSIAVVVARLAAQKGVTDE